MATSDRVLLLPPVEADGVSVVDSKTAVEGLGEGTVVDAEQALLVAEP
jgi:hypothetical protein